LPSVRKIRQRLEQCGGKIGNGSLRPALLSLSITKVVGVPAQTRSL
jgi:hypothetical protein